MVVGTSAVGKKLLKNHIFSLMPPPPQQFNGTTIKKRTFLGFHNFLERDAPYNPLCTHYSNNNNDNDVVGHSTKYTFYRVTY